MTEMAKEARREYMRRWRAENKDRVAEHTARFYEKKSLERKEAEKRGKTEEAAS